MNSNAYNVSLEEEVVEVEHVLYKMECRVRGAIVRVEQN
jgi:hypothetical protein